MHFYRLLGLDIAQCSAWGPLTCRGWGEGGGMCSVDWPGQEGERELGVLGVRVGAYGLIEEILEEFPGIILWKLQWAFVGGPGGRGGQGCCCP